MQYLIYAFEAHKVTMGIMLFLFTLFIACLVMWRVIDAKTSTADIIKRNRWEAVRRVQMRIERPIFALFVISWVAAVACLLIFLDATSDACHADLLPKDSKACRKWF